MKLARSLLVVSIAIAFPSSVFPIESQDFRSDAEESFLKIFKDPRLNPKSWNKFSPEEEAELLEQVAVPNYLHKFQELFQNNVNNELVDKLFENVSNDHCKAHVMEWFFRMGDASNQTNILTDQDKWVVQMSDSWGKLPEGILTGHVNLWGDFNECVETEVTDLTIFNKYFRDGISNKFEGQYCSSYILEYNMAKGALEDMLNEQRSTKSKIEHTSLNGSYRHAEAKEVVSPVELITTILTQDLGLIMMIPSIATCWPSSCSQVDVQAILINSFNITYTLVFRENLPAFLPGPVTTACQVLKKPGLDGATIFMIVFLSVLVALCVGTGILDYALNHEVENPPHRGLAYQYLMAFSLYTNTKKWMSTRKSADDMGCIHGIRFLSTAWVVLGHTYFAFISGPIWNYIDVKRLYKNWTVLAVLNATFSVDTFFVMSGLLACYGIMKALQKTKGKFNVPMFYVHRYIRLTPTYAILLGIVATLYKYISSGPTWTSIIETEENCRKNWWTNLLYINNIFRTDAMCNGESWYLANDMQFYILSPFIVYPLWRWEKIGVQLLSIYTGLSIMAPVLVVHYTDAPPAMVVTGKMGFAFNEIYYRPWSRIQTFLVGIWAGWLLFKTRGKKLRIPRVVTLLIWVASTALALTVIFAIKPWYDPKNEIPKAEGDAYAGLSRFSWGTVIAWVIFACVKGHGGFINTFLSWKIFMPLGRLCFSVYLVSIHLQDIFHAHLATPLRYDSYTMVNLFFAHMVMSYLIGFICTLLFESPFIVLQKLIFEGGSPNLAKQPVTMLSGKVKPNGTVLPTTNGHSKLSEDIENNNQKLH